MSKGIAIDVEAIDVPIWQRGLVYVDYRDSLSPEQVENVLHQGWDDHVDEWVSESQWRNAHELAAELLPEEHTDDDMDIMVERLIEMDTSTPYTDLLGNTGTMLFRHSPDEDGMAHLCEELDAPDDALNVLGLSPEFLPAITEILPEIAGYKWEGGGYFGATFVFSCNAGDMFDAMNKSPDGDIVIHNPFLWITNPWSGNGWGEIAEGCTVTLNRGAIHVDSQAWGYGADDVFGGLCLPDSTVESAS